jgi:hypothetical protein
MTILTNSICNHCSKYRKDQDYCSFENDGIIECSDFSFSGNKTQKTGRPKIYNYDQIILGVLTNKTDLEISIDNGCSIDTVQRVRFKNGLKKDQRGVLVCNH